MAKRYNIAALRKKFKEFDIEARKVTSRVVQSSADIVVSNAKRKAPANNGQLRQSIGKEPFDEGLGARIYAGASYASYMEFGTGGRVKVPAEMQEIANQFKGGTGGTFEDMLQAIQDWIRQKGFAGTYSVKTRKRTNSKASRENEERAAYVIAVSILKKGIRPRPFLHPSFVEEREKVPSKIDKALQLAAKDFNRS